MGQVNIHVDGSNRMLKIVTPIQNRYGILKIFYAHLIDGYAAVIALILNIFHI
jgi:hypothetical protein